MVTREGLTPSPAQRITFQQLVTLQQASQDDPDPRASSLLRREEGCPPFLEAVEAPFRVLPSGSEDEPLAEPPPPVPSPVPRSPLDFRRPAPCSFLRSGQTFKGKQSVQRASVRDCETWTVTVLVHEVDWERGVLRGAMAADNVPRSRRPVRTLWEGELVDNVNHSFATRRWGAQGEADRKHWGKFQAYLPLKRQVARYGGRCPQLAEWPTIFMRWKETSFLDDSSEECGLTIAGFYYAALCRQTGRIEGFYFDSASTPSQRVELAAAGCEQAPGPQSFGVYSYQ